MNPIRTIVVAYDFSEHAEAALGVATDLAVRLGAGLHLLHVVQPPSYAYATGDFPGSPIDTLHLHSEAERHMNEIVAKLPELPLLPAVHVVEGSSIADTIDEQAAALGCDLIVMGTHGRTGLSHVLHGSVAERTVRRSPCPVLTVPLPAQAHYAAEHPRPRAAAGVPW